MEKSTRRGAKRYIDIAKELPPRSYDPWKEAKEYHSFSNTCKLYVLYCIQNAVLSYNM